MVNEPGTTGIIRSFRIRTFPIMSTEMITPDFGPSSSAVLSWTGSSDTFQLDASEQQPLWRPSVTMDDEGKRHQSIQVSLPCINVSLFCRYMSLIQAS